MACPGYHYHRKAFLAYKRGRKTEERKKEKKERGKKTQGTKENTGRETRPQHQQSLLPESSFFFPFVFFFPSADQRTHQPLCLSIFFFHPFIFKSKPATSGFPGFWRFRSQNPQASNSFSLSSTTLLPQLIIFLPHAAPPLRETIVH
jgi:hypothetical protein